MAPSGTGSDGQRPLSDERQVEEVGGNCGSPCVRCAPKCGGDFHRSGRYSGKWGLPSSARPTASAPIFFPLTLIRSAFVFPALFFRVWLCESMGKDPNDSQVTTRHHSWSFRSLEWCRVSPASWWTPSQDQAGLREDAGFWSRVFNSMGHPPPSCRRAVRVTRCARPTSGVSGPHNSVQ